MSGVKLAVEEGRSFTKTVPEASTLRAFEVWEEKLGVEASISDKNFFRLFRECGYELRFLSMIIPPRDERGQKGLKEVVLDGYCHTVAFVLARAARRFRNKDLTIWFGFIDEHSHDKGYAGTLCHSFLTRPVEATDTICLFDPLLTRLVVEGDSARILNHCGVPIPYKYARESHKRARSVGLSWTRYMFRFVLSSEKKTDLLIKAIKEQKIFHQGGARTE